MLTYVESAYNNNTWLTDLFIFVKSMYVQYAYTESQYIMNYKDNKRKWKHLFPLCSINVWNYEIIPNNSLH